MSNTRRILQICWSWFHRPYVTVGAPRRILTLPLEMVFVSSLRLCFAPEYHPHHLYSKHERKDHSQASALKNLWRSMFLWGHFLHTSLARFNEMEKKGVGLDVITFDMNTIVQLTLDDVLDKNWGERSKISSSRMEGGSDIAAAATGRSCLHWPSLHLGSCWIPPCWLFRVFFSSQVRTWQFSRTR